MKFCMSCGREINETARFCPHCGAASAPAPGAPEGAKRPEENAVQPGAQPDVSAQASVDVMPKSREAGPAPGGAKKKTPRIALIIAAVVVVLAAALLIGASAALNTPKALIGKSISNTIKSLRVADEGALGVVRNVLNGGSIEVSADLNEWEDLYGSLPMTARMKLYSNLADKKFAAEMSLSFDGERPIDATLYASPDSLVLGSDALLKGKYGVNLKKATANLEKSIFAPDSGSDFEMDEYTYEMLRAFFESFGEKNKELEKNVKDLSNKYIELLIDAACDAGEAEKESVTLDIGSEQVKTTAVTLTLDGKAMADVVRTVAKEAAKDTKLRETVKEIAILNSSTIFSYDYYYGYYSASDLDDIEEQTDALFDNLVDNAEEIAEYIEREEDIRLVLEFYVAKDGKTLAAFTMKAKEDGKTAFSLNLTLGKRLGSSEEISLKINDGWSDTIIRYVVSENSKTNYSAKLTYQDWYSSETIRITWDKSDGAYRISAEDFEVRGTLRQSGKKTTVTVNEISEYGYKSKIDLTIVLNESESVPSPGSYTDILAVTESQFEGLAEDVADRIMDSALYSVLDYVFWYYF